MKKWHYDKSVTSRDVAKLAGVSQSTVSRVFNSAKSNVKDEARRRVLEAAEELGYRPNFMARGMISGKTNIVGIVVGEGMGPFYHRLIHLLIMKLQSIGKQSLLFRMDERDQILNIVMKVAQFQVDQIIITAPAMQKDIVDIQVKTDIPILLLNRSVDSQDLHCVCTDAYAGSELAAKYLLDCGHRKIGYIGYTKETFEEAAKWQAFERTVDQCGGVVTDQLYSAYTYQAGYDAACNLIRKGNFPSAIFCTSDLIAIGAIDALREQFGLRVPEDLSVVGYDDIEMSRWKSYNLTTVRQPYDFLVDETIATLLRLEEKDKPITPYHVNVEPLLIVRGSVVVLTQ